jgi:hypothetical protein
VAEDNATKTAEATAMLEPRFADIDRQFAAVRSDLRILKLQVSLMIGGFVLVSAGRGLAPVLP